MYDIKNYYKSTIHLINSLVIKIDEISKHFNYHFFIKQGKPIPKFEDDKYYLNLAGKRTDYDPI